MFFLKNMIVMVFGILRSGMFFFISFRVEFISGKFEERVGYRLVFFGV